MKRVMKILNTIVIIAAIICFYFYVGSLNDIDKKSEYYTNNLYLSEEYIYNHSLTKDQKDIYDLFINVVNSRDRKYNTTFKDLNCSGSFGKCKSDIERAYKALIIDHPEMLDLASFSYIYSPEAETIDISIYYATPFKLLNYVGETYIGVVLEKIKEETADMTDAEKIVYVYNWIGDRATYDYTFTDASKNQSAYNAVVKRNAVCAGFAKTANIIFQYIGIKSYGIIGHNHMWNIIEYDGKYYYFDSTTAACIKKDSDQYYDGLRQEKMNSYGVDFKEWYPKIETTNFPFLEEVIKDNEKE